MQKPRHPKHLATASSVSPEPPDSSKIRQSGSSSDGTEAPYPPANPMSPLAVGPFSSPEGTKDSETGRMILSKRSGLRLCCEQYIQSTVLMQQTWKCVYAIIHGLPHLRHLF